MSIPKWVTIAGAFIALMGLFVGGSLYVSPGTFIENVDFSLVGSRFLAYMWGARQVAIASIIGLSLIRRSADWLRVSLIAYCLMNVQDVGIGLWLDDMGLAIGASIAGALSGSMILVLSRKTSQ